MEQNAITTSTIDTLFPSEEEDENDLRLYGATQDTSANVAKVRPTLKDVCCS